MHPELFTIPGVNISVPSFGAVVMIGFLLATFWAARRCAKVKIDPDMTLNIGFIILIFGFLSARVFYVVHYWSTEFAHQPAQAFNIRAGGMEIYGGIIGGVIACAAYIRLKHMSLRLFADIVAPSLLLAMGIGRIGCFLFGCCWGATCPEHLPWAVRFPFFSPAFQQQWEQRLVTAPAELIVTSPDGKADPCSRQFLSFVETELPTTLTQLKSTIEGHWSQRVMTVPAELITIGPDGRGTVTPRPMPAISDPLLAKELDNLQSLLNKASLPVPQKVAGQHKQLAQAVETIAVLNNHFVSFKVTPQTLRVEAARPEFACRPVHPAQIYSAIGPVLLALMTGSYFYRRKRHGTVFLLGFALYAVERFIEELLRTDNPLDTFGLTVSQAISVAVLILAAIFYAVFLRMPLRSPRAVGGRQMWREKVGDPEGRWGKP